MSATESKSSYSVVRVRWLHKLSRLQLVFVLLSALVAATAIGIWMRHVSDRQHSAIGTSLQIEKGSASPGVAASSGHGSNDSSAASSAAPTASSTSTQSAQSSSASGALTGTAYSANANASTGAASSSRMVIKSAQVRLVVSNVNHISDHLTQVATAAGGFVQSLNTSRQNTASQPLISLVLRIPDSKFTSFLDTVKSLGSVQSLSQSGVDVTQQNNNLQNKLQQLQSEEKAYTRLFQQAKSMKDMLQIQSSLTQVNNEIASVQQQLHNLHRSVALSTVSITLTQKTPATVKHAKPLWGALLQSLAFMKTSALGLIAFLAWIVPWGILVAVLSLVWRYIRQLRRSKS